MIPTPTTRIVLIVDDSSMVVNALTYAFRANGYNAVGAEGGAEALKIAGTVSVDVAVVDINMPTMDGFAVCRALKELARQQGRALAVWLMTGAPSPQASALAIGAGAKGVFSKPFEFKTVCAQIEAAFAAPAV